MVARPAKPKIPRRPVTGILLLDKPAGMSSNAALQRARFVFGADKGGHTGNLDVAATGLLPICLGEATKVSAWLLDSDKRYLADVRLGVTTSTGDAEGIVLREAEVTPEMRERVPAVLAGQLGSQWQIPPMYSALKRDGRPLYELARSGVEVEREARRITIHALSLLALEGDVLRIEVACSKGTYIRVLAETIGEMLGCGASLSALRRTRAGPFNLAEAVPLAHFEGVDWPSAQFDALLLPADAALGSMAAIVLPAGGEAAIRQGRAVSLRGSYPSGPIRIYRTDGEFTGLGEVTPEGSLQPRRLLASASRGAALGLPVKSVVHAECGG